MTPRFRILFVLFSALAFFPVGAAMAADDDNPTPSDQRKAEKFKPTATVTIDATTVAVGVGVSWGEGVLTFQNENHPFKVGGLSLVGVGGSSMKAEGTVFDLEKIEDFKGTWAEASGAGVFVENSVGGLTLRNGDVYMTLSGEQAGLQLSAGGGGMTIDFKDVAADKPAE